MLDDHHVESVRQFPALNLRESELWIRPASRKLCVQLFVCNAHFPPRLTLRAALLRALVGTSCRWLRILRSGSYSENETIVREIRSRDALNVCRRDNAVAREVLLEKSGIACKDGVLVELVALAAESAYALEAVDERRLTRIEGALEIRSAGRLCLDRLDLLVDFLFDAVERHTAAR